MRRRPASTALVLLLALASGCGADAPAGPDAACTSSPDVIERALGRAPSPVTLDGGARLSDCVALARSDAQLQNAGAVLTRTADELAARAQTGDAKAALALGYLVGAARRGAARTAGLQAQLQRRVEGAAAFVGVGGPAVSAALRRGLRAGEATG
jgi:hypothetical protein